MQIFLWDKGTETGPHDSAALQTAIQQGKTSSKVLARLAADSNWRPLELILPRQVATPQPSAPQQVKRRTGQIVCKCPKCGSDAIQSAPVLFESGMSSFSGQTRGVGVSGIGGVELTPVMAGGWTSGTTVSALAQRFAPPQELKRKPTYAAVFFAVLAALVTKTLVTILGIAGGGWLLVFFALVGIAFGVTAYRWFQYNQKVRAFNQNEFPVLLTQWKESWFCHRCGFFGPLE